jgi:hypothetical protein
MKLVEGDSMGLGMIIPEHMGIHDHVTLGILNKLYIIHSLVSETDRSQFICN